MNLDQGTELRNGKIINSSSETSSPADPGMAQTSSNDFDANEASDISSQLSEELGSTTMIGRTSSNRFQIQCKK